MPKFRTWTVWLSLSFLACSFPTAAQSRQLPIVPGVKTGPFGAQGTAASAVGQELPEQRLLGVVPNFYVSYVHHAVPLNAKQKFELAWKTTIDPVSFGLTGAIAGIQQAQNDFSGYGQGAQGYGRRFGASYGNFLAGTYI